MFGSELPQYTQDALAELVDKANKILDEYGFYLAGGTATAIQLKHRKSIDLDWFSEKTFDPQVLVSDLKDCGLEFNDISTSKGTLYIRVGECSVSFMEYRYKRIGDYVKHDNGFIMASLVDIGLMKITAIADRGTKKDFTDIYFIAKELGGLYKIMEKFPEKYPGTNEYHYLKSLTYFEDAENMPELDLMNDVSWESIKKYIKRESRDWIKRNNF